MKKKIILLVGILIINGFGVSAISEKERKTISQTSFIEEFDMVIIAPELFSENLQPLIDHKNTIGVHTFMKTTEDIYNEYEGRDKPEQIKYFIKYVLENLNITYVMLVGGANLLPARYVHIYYNYEYQDEWIFLSDLYYADIYDEHGIFSSWDTNENDIFGEYNWGSQHLYDDVDLYPDVYLGRLACINENEVIICINKIITYETEKAYVQPWFTDLVVIGGDSLPGDEEQIDEGEYVNEGVIDNMDGFIPKRIWASNGELYDALNIQDAIDSGAGFVFFNGHGNLDIWATHPHESYEWIPPGFYTNSHLNALSNGNELPIVLSDACYHCTYDVASDCFGWSFVKNPNGGCIAFLGSTDIDVSHEGVDIITKGIEKLCIVMSENYMEGEFTFGELWGHGIHDYLTSAEMDEMDYITVEEFQPFGDPSLTIAEESQPPEKPNIDGIQIGADGVEYEFTIKTTDPEDEGVYNYVEWGDETNSGWIGPFPSGEEVIVNHTWNEIGDYEIRAKAKDVRDKESVWSDIHPMTIVENEPPNKPEIDGSSSGNIGILYTYKFTSVDPDYNDVYFIIDWDDGSSEETIGPFQSGVEGTAKHKWTSQETYYIRAKTKDIYCEESDLVTFTVIITKTREVNIPLLNFLQNHPNLFPILKRLLQRYRNTIRK